MKLISLKVGLFESNNDKLVDFFAEQQADIVALTEVTKTMEESALPQFVSFEAINSGTPDLPNASFDPTTIFKRFAKDNFHGQEHFVFDIGGKVELGQYLRSRYPIKQAQAVFVQNQYAYVEDWSRWPEEDYRLVQVVDLLVDGQELRILNYHGIWSQDKQGTAKTLAACQTIKDLALEKSASIIVGDFNLFPKTASMQVFADLFTSLVDTYQIRTTRPPSNELSHLHRNVIDYILVSDAIQVNDFQVLNSDVSDHLPQVLDFSLKQSTQ